MVEYLFLDEPHPAMAPKPTMALAAESSLCRCFNCKFKAYGRYVAYNNGKNQRFYCNTCIEKLGLTPVPFVPYKPRPTARKPPWRADPSDHASALPAT